MGRIANRLARWVCSWKFLQGQIAVREEAAKERYKREVWDAWVAEMAHLTDEKRWKDGGVGEDAPSSVIAKFHLMPASIVAMDAPHYLRQNYTEKRYEKNPVYVRVVTVDQSPYVINQAKSAVVHEMAKHLLEEGLVKFEYERTGHENPYGVTLTGTLMKFIHKP